MSNKTGSARLMTSLTREAIVDDRKILDGIRIESGLSWKEFFHQLAIYPLPVKEVMNLPKEINPNMISNTATVTKLMPIWLKALSENIAEIKNGKDIKDIPKTNEPALVIGAGPSLYRNKHLDVIANSGFDGLIFATDKVLIDCLEAGVIPNYVLISDASDKILPFIDHDIIDEYRDDISAIMCVTTHPTVVKRWRGDKYFFVQMIPEVVAPNVSYVLRSIIDKTEMVTAGHCASVGWCTAFELGCNPIVLVGVDLSYPVDLPIEETQYFKMYQECCEDIDEIKKHFVPYRHGVFGTVCYSDDVFRDYLFCSMDHFRFAKQNGIKIVNCTEGGVIGGEGVACMKLTDFYNGVA